MLAWSIGHWKAGCRGVAFGVLSAIAAHSAFAQKPPCAGLPKGDQQRAREMKNCVDPPVKGANKTADDPKEAYPSPAKAPPTKDSAEIDRLRGLLGDAIKHTNDAETHANNAEKRASDAEEKAAFAAKTAAAANEQMDKLRKELEQATNTGAGKQKDLDEARADVQKHVANETALNSQIDKLNSRISVLGAIVTKEIKGLLLVAAVALLLGSGFGFVLARVFPKPQPRISVPPGATVRAHVVLNMAQSQTRLDGACPAEPTVHVAATLGPGITQLTFPG